MGDRPDVPEEFVARIDAVLGGWRGVTREPAWVGIRWKVRDATIAHVFGGEDFLFRIIFRGEPDEVAAFDHMGPPYFKVAWGSNVIGMTIDEHTDWDELAEALQDSYRIQAPVSWAADA
ncbi:hypothetical protein [Actinomycetospora termitidis]|uniref:MmcQ/YjbR family DNA-binding protein n=1 Tax=Actinomycetospora termitidis TaxID=3053470 RepID=A0ABT7MF63_9PSEU|nr:hypothetical protein [Actinomycetospora sp. Odt1-22]MDL5159303.1 hypothetical protein [Actinomycetospora sp. Odt1-22]